METVTLGRARRTTAGNRMRELLEKAHQEDDDDLFKEVENDEEFEAPVDQRDVFLEEFADTDDEIEEDEDEDARLRREERRRSSSGPKHKPLLGSKATPTLTPAQIALLDPSLDPAAMAPSTLMLMLRQQKREAKRANRSENRRSTMRASTLRTEEEILERERGSKENPGRKGRKAQHEGGEVRGQRVMTQDELIAAALEQEEANKEALRDWLRKEEERRELRRVGRKRVRGPRWTWISRTVGRLVEAIEDPGLPIVAGEQESALRETESPQIKEVEVAGLADAQVSQPVTGDQANQPATAVEGHTLESSDVQQPPTTTPQIQLDPPMPVASEENSDLKSPMAPSITPIAASLPQVPGSTESAVVIPSQPDISTPGPSSEPVLPAITDVTHPDQPSGSYARNYLILSQIPGGLPAELELVLGSHVDWASIQHIPARNRPINRRPPSCPFTGLPAKYKHPLTGIQYATAEGYRLIEGLLKERYLWSESGWLGGEEDVGAEGVDEVEGWREAVHGGWMAGTVILNEDEELEEEEEAEEEHQVEDLPVEEEPVEEVETVKLPYTGKKRGRKSKAELAELAAAAPAEGRDTTDGERVKKKGKKKQKPK